LACSALAVSVAMGCTTIPRSSDHKGKSKTSRAELQAREQFHVIELNPDGLLYDLRPHHGHALIRGQKDVTNYLAETIWAGFKASPKTNILVFVHGGMNDRDVGLKHYLDDYEAAQTNYYPVFVVWPSGWGSTYVEHLLWVRQGIKMETKLEKTFSLLTAPFILVADLGRAVTRLPMVIANNTRSDTETITPARKQDSGTPVKDYREIVSKGYRVHIEDDYSRWDDRLLRDVSYNVTLPVKYVFAALIDGLGQGAWDNMLRRTQTVYPGRMDRSERMQIAETLTVQTTNSLTQYDGKKPRRQRRKEKRTKRYAAAGLPAFFELLRNFQTTNGTASQITLVGHSMGAIILNRVARDTKIDFAKIVYMGAACSIEDFSTSVLPYLREHTNTEFYSLSLHPVAEAGEWYLIAGDLVPRGSLLMWLDNFLMNPVTEQERTLGRWRNLFRTSATGEPVIQRFFDNDSSGSLTNRLHFRAFSVGVGGSNEMRSLDYQWNDKPIPRTLQERRDTPLGHGDFTEMPYWSKEFWWKD
jgi:pimeloyl-ACP methyl ester carboxylesterase